MLPVTPPSWCCPQDNTARVQEDLEGEFQSLYVLLDELKDGMVTKIKQERASRTYELQVSPRVSPPPNTHTQRGGSPRHPAAPLSPADAAGGLRQGAGELGGAAGDGQPDPADRQQPRLHRGEPLGTHGCWALSPPGCPRGGDRGCPVSPPPPPPLPALLGTFFSFFCAGHCDDAALAAPAAGLG